QTLIRKPFTEQNIFDTLSQHLGVRYLYSTDSSAHVAPLNTSGSMSASATTPATAELTRADLAATMPRDWINTLHTAAAVLDADSCLKLIKQVPDDAIINTLTDLVHNFRFDILLELSQSLETSG
ncbi:MAG: hypothetical protein AAGC54_01195, partial [Cyanobacteria bacterium P01_F01_bin.4]